MPKIYDGWFDDQIAKQAATAMGKALAAGYVREKEFVSLCWRKPQFNSACVFSVRNIMKHESVHLLSCLREPK
jgi:hypothetical protein